MAMTSRSARWAAALAFLVTVFAFGRARAQDVSGTITFDDLPLNSVVTTQYTAQGLPVLFDSNIVINGDDANPTNHVLINKDPDIEFNNATMTLTFISPQNLVSLNGSFFGTPTETRNLTVSAFDAGGTLLSSQTQPVGGDSLGTLFTVSAASDLITSVVATTSSIDGNVEIDNLHFVGEPAPANNITAPVVVIASPPQSPISNSPNVELIGTVTGQQVLSPATVTLTFQPAPGQPGQISRPVTLTQTSPTTFTFDEIDKLPPGLVTITVEAQNTFGTTGSASVVAENLPLAIQTACVLNPTAGLGKFDYGISLPSCDLIVCENLPTQQQPTVRQFGLALGPNSQLVSVSPTVLAKWQSVQGIVRLGPLENLGCPVANAVNVGAALPPPAKTPSEQAFEFGRIYEDSSSNDFYVPGVFANAIQVGGDDTAVGIPTSDPKEGTVAIDVQTFWFQHFNRGFAGDLGTTMELRGIPTVLSVERQGGDLRDMTAVGLTPSATTATIWQKYPCTGSGPWSCPVTLAQHDIGVTQSDDTLNRDCAYPNGNNLALGATYPFNNGLEWVAVQAQSAAQLDPANYAYQSVQGWIRPNGSFKAKEDNPDTHQCFDIEDVSPPDIFWPSDWNLDIWPLPRYDNLLGKLNFQTKVMEIENELCVMQWFFGATGGFPMPGDLVFVNGRWIVDCGHQPNGSEFLTEIHPIAVFSRAETVNTLAQGFSFSATATVEPIAVNGVFVQGPTTVSVYPPPRPSPDAVLTTITTGQDGAFGDLVLTTTAYSDHVDMTFNAPFAMPLVEPSSGEVDNNFSRGFQGIAYAFWQ
jgi:hypothetical protein